MGQTGLSGRMPGRQVNLGAATPRVQAQPASGNKTYIKLPGYRPNLGQATTTVPAQAPSGMISDATMDYAKGMGQTFLGGGLFGAVLGSGMSLAYPKTRLTRNQALTTMGISAAVAALAALINKGNPKEWLTTIVGFSGLVAGNALPSVVVPRQEFGFRPEGMLAIGRRN